MEKILIIVIVLVILLVLYVIGVYNKLVTARNKVNNQLSQIDVQLKRRADLIPNLVETAKGYAKHEKDTFKEVVEARNLALTANSIDEKAAADKELTGALNKLFALTEAYPELKANENFMTLQNDLRDSEDKITYARQFYNDSAMSFNDLVGVFPSNIIVKLFGFKPFNFFNATEEDKKTPKVKF